MKGLMKTKIRLFLLLLFCVQTAFGSPLIFKVSKKIDSKDFIELGNFDASKYSRIRVFVKVTTPDGSRPISKETAQTELAYAKSQEHRAQKLFSSGDISRLDYEKAAEALRDAQAALDNAFSAQIVGVVDAEEIPVLVIDQKNIANSMVVDVPPSLIRIKVQGKGTVTFYAWGM
ncbi:MAG: hypothetical protein WBD16_04220 [Pyrinomonadaceae bacterium]